jgi:hypothetical protein
MNPWHDKNTQPPVPNVYRTRLYYDEVPTYQYWDGTCWGNSELNINDARKAAGTRGAYQIVGWRYIEEDDKDAN